MNILYILPASYFGGAEKMLLDLVDNLPKRIRPVFMLPNGKLAEMIQTKGYIVEFNDDLAFLMLDTSKYFAIFKLMKNIFTNTCRILKAIDAYDIHLIHANKLQAVVYCLLAANIKRKNIIWTNHDVFKKSIINLIRMWLAKSYATLSIHVSQATLNQIFKEKNNNKIIYNGIDIGKLDKLQIQKIKKNIGYLDDHIYLGIFGSIISIKGQYEFLLIFHKIIKKRPKTNLLIIGANSENIDQNYYEKIRYYVYENKLHQNVKILPFTNQILAYYKVVDFVINYSQIPEALPYTMIEAMGYGSIPIGMDKGGILEVIKNGHNGFLLKHSSHQKNFEVILGILEHYSYDKTYFNEIKLNAFNTVQRKFPLSQMITNYLKIYQDNTS